MRKVVRELSSMLMGLFMMVPFMKDTIMELVRLPGLMGISIRAIGNEVRWMVLGFLGILQGFC